MTLLSIIPTLNNTLFKDQFEVYGSIEISKNVEVGTNLGKYNN